MIFRLKRSILELFDPTETTDRTPRTISKAIIMKHIILTLTAAIGLTSAAFAGPGDDGFGLMDDLFPSYDDSAVELPGEDARKPSVSRSTQLVDDSDLDAWIAREAEKQAKKEQERQAAQQQAEQSSSSSRTSSSSRENDPDGSASGSLSRWNEVGPDGEVNFNPFKNDYKYKGGNKPTDGSRPEFEETRSRIKDILGDGVPKTMTDAKLEELLHNPARQATELAPTTPAKWVQAPNDWFCDYDDAMSKAETSGRAVAVFFHSSTNDESRRFKTERMENNKFKTRMRGRLLVVYLDYPEKETGRDKRCTDQVDHDRRIAEKFHVNSYPTVVFLSSNGTEVGRMSGTKALNAFLDEADKYVPEKDTTVKNPTGFKIGGSIGMGESRLDYPSD